MPSKFSDSLHLHRQYCIEMYIYIYVCIFVCVQNFRENLWDSFTIGPIQWIEHQPNRASKRGSFTWRLKPLRAQHVSSRPRYISGTNKLLDVSEFLHTLHLSISRFSSNLFVFWTFPAFGFTHLPKWCLRSQLSWQNSASQNKNETKKTEVVCFNRENLEKNLPITFHERHEQKNAAQKATFLPLQETRVGPPPRVKAKCLWLEHPYVSTKGMLKYPERHMNETIKQGSSVLITDVNINLCEACANVKYPSENQSSFLENYIFLSYCKVQDRLVPIFHFPFNLDAWFDQSLEW